MLRFVWGKCANWVTACPQNDQKAAELYANEYHFYMAPNDPNYIHPEKYPNGVIDYAPTTERALERLFYLWSHGRGLPDDKDKKLPGYRGKPT